MRGVCLRGHGMGGSEDDRGGGLSCTGGTKGLNVSSCCGYSEKRTRIDGQWAWFDKVLHPSFTNAEY